jgi:hypothetical protein
MGRVHLICGVPGAGKSWVASKLEGFDHRPHDSYPVKEYGQQLINASRDTHKPVLAEAPFRIGDLVAEMMCSGVDVITYYISEPEHVIKQRYENRMGKPFSKQHSSNLRRYDEREWDYRGTSQEILNILQEVER